MAGRLCAAAAAAATRALSADAAEGASVTPAAFPFGLRGGLRVAAEVEAASALSGGVSRVAILSQRCTSLLIRPITEGASSVVIRSRIRSGAIRRRPRRRPVTPTPSPSSRSARLRWLRPAG